MYQGMTTEINRSVKIDIIAGARPNFIKIAAIIHALHAHNEKAVNPILYRLIHTGQHYDAAMSQNFFEQLNLPEPHINFGVGSGSQAYQTGQIMLAYENALKLEKPDLCIVVGDVTSTMACTLVAKKEGVAVAHVEGGIRSGDMTMPEEVNRIVTDSIADYFFTTSRQANENLLSRGVNEEQIFFVGNTMIDTLITQLPNLKKPDFFEELELVDRPYLVVTLHRPSNVDSMEGLDRLLTLLNGNANGHKLIFPMHPRTKKIFESIGKIYPHIYLTSPMDYLSFIYLVNNAKGVVTDSGGITEETTVLGIPCMTLRNTTERPETVTIGTNVMVGTDEDNIVAALHQMTAGQWKKGDKPELWDGFAGQRIVEILNNKIFNNVL